METETSEKGVSENMATKKTAKTKSKKATKRAPGKRYPKTLGAAACIRSIPVTMKAKDVVTEAKKRGFNVTESYVYNVRLNARKKGGAAPQKRGAAVSPRAMTSTPGFKTRAMELADRFINDLTDCLMQSIRGA